MRTRKERNSKIKNNVGRVKKLEKKMLGIFNINILLKSWYFIMIDVELY